MSDVFIHEPPTLKQGIVNCLREWVAANMIEDGAGGQYVEVGDLAETMDAQANYLIEAMDEEPPLEDVLMACGVSMLTVHVLPPKEGSQVRVVLEAQYGDKRRKPKHGTGPTINAAIRAAVANAKGEN